MFDKMKIIPLLIVVSMLSFSVRLVEFGFGVKDFSGAAFAEEEMDSKDKNLDSGGSKPDDDDDQKGAAAGEGAMSDSGMAAGDDAAMMDDGESSGKWRDASDLDEGVSAVRMEMFEDLTRRREKLEQRERTLVTREALLKAAEQELERKYQEMAALRSEIESLLEEQSEQEKARITSLVKIYEGMKAKDAARIFDTLDLDVLVNVMSQMSERKIAPILAAMNPERARSVTIMLAEQISLPDLPKN